MDNQNKTILIKHTPGLYAGNHEIAYTMMPPRLGLKKLKAGLQEEFPWLEIQTVKRRKGGFEVHAVAKDVPYAAIPIYWERRSEVLFNSWGVDLYIENYKPEPRPVYKINFFAEKINPELFLHIAECPQLPFKVETIWGLEEIDSLKTLLLDYKVKAAQYRETHPEWVDPEWDIEWYYV